MTRTLALVLAVSIAGCSRSAQDERQRTGAIAATPTPRLSSMAATPGPKTSTALPADVVGFREKRDACDQLRGEEPYDEARAEELARSLKATCTGTDRALAALKARHRDDAAVTEALNGYDATVE